MSTGTLCPSRGGGGGERVRERPRAWVSRPTKAVFVSCLASVPVRGVGVMRQRTVRGGAVCEKQAGRVRVCRMRRGLKCRNVVRAGGDYSTGMAEAEADARVVVAWSGGEAGLGVGSGGSGGSGRRSQSQCGGRASIACGRCRGRVWQRLCRVNARPHADWGLCRVCLLFCQPHHF